MPRILMIHNTDMANQDYFRKVSKKYPIMKAHADKLKVDVIKAGKKLSKAHLKEKYDSIYFDKATVTVHDIIGYITQTGHPQIIPINLSQETKAGKKEKNMTFIMSPIKNLRKGK